MPNQEKPRLSERTTWAYNFTGWVLFTMSALLFLWTTWIAADVIGTLASLAFLVACLVFLVPVWINRPSRDD